MKIDHHKIEAVLRAIEERLPITGFKLLRLAGFLGVQACYGSQAISGFIDNRLADSYGLHLPVARIVIRIEKHMRHAFDLGLHASPARVRSRASVGSGSQGTQGCILPRLAGLVGRHRNLGSQLVTGFMQFRLAG
jgi:hypothetical protein